MNPRNASFSLASIIAIVSAILSFTAGAFFGLILAAVAFIFGVFGIVLALSPSTRGGAMSILAILLSFVGVIAAIIKALIWILGG